MTEDNELIECEAAFLVALAEHGVGLDVLGVLVHGNDRGTIARGGLRKGITAVITAYRNHQVEL